MLTKHQCKHCSYAVWVEASAAAVQGKPVCPRHMKDLLPVANAGEAAQRPSPAASGSDFRLELLNASMDVAHLAASIGRARLVPAARVLLYGPPGTGKSAYARHLAERIGIEPRIVSYGEIASRFVGETEQTIRKVFLEAEGANQLLVLDEVDSLVRTRAAATHGWERTQVNEMLQALDRLATPIAMTTNDIGEIDPAMMRRVDFKVECRAFETPDQIRAAFGHFFDQELPEECADLAELALTAGDFAVVRRRAAFTGLDGDGLVAALRHEASFKLSKPMRQPIGFQVQAA